MSLIALTESITNNMGDCRAVRGGCLDWQKRRVRARTIFFFLPPNKRWKQTRDWNWKRWSSDLRADLLILFFFFSWTDLSYLLYWALRLLIFVKTSGTKLTSCTSLQRLFQFGYSGVRSLFFWVYLVILTGSRTKIKNQGTEAGHHILTSWRKSQAIQLLRIYHPFD